MALHTWQPIEIQNVETQLHTPQGCLLKQQLFWTGSHCSGQRRGADSTSRPSTAQHRLFVHDQRPYSSTSKEKPRVSRKHVEECIHSYWVTIKKFSHERIISTTGTNRRRHGYQIEQVFGSIKRWFGRLPARYVGLAKMHGQHVMERPSLTTYIDVRGWCCPNRSNDRHYAPKGAACLPQGGNYANRSSKNDCRGKQ